VAGFEPAAPLVPNECSSVKTANRRHDQGTRRQVVDPLTSPDKEDWTIIPDGERVHMVAYREQDGTAVMAHGNPVSMCEFRKGVRTLLRDKSRGFGKL